MKQLSTDKSQEGTNTAKENRAIDIEATHPLDIEEVDHSDIDAVKLSDIDELDFTEIHDDYLDSPQCVGIDEDSDTDMEQTSSSLENSQSPNISLYTPEAGRCRNLASYKAG